MSIESDIRMGCDVHDLCVDEYRTSYPLDTVDALLQGISQVYCFPGTSQYSQGSPSGCGIAVLNCVRIILGWERHEHISAQGILERLCNKGTMDVCFRVPHSFRTSF